MLVSVLLMGLSGCSSEVASSEISHQTASPAVQQQEQLTVTDFSWENEEYGTRYLVGTVKNNVNKEFSYCQIEFNLYDKENGSQVGSTFDNINNLEADGTWKFKAIVMEDGATFAKLKGVSCW